MLTNWIMSCVNTTSFAVLVNGGPTSFFEAGEGFKQGFPLSPLLFILVMEGLSLMLKQVHKQKEKFLGLRHQDFSSSLYYYSWTMY
jgi:hypothetical protein